MIIKIAIFAIEKELNMIYYYRGIFFFLVSVFMPILLLAQKIENVGFTNNENSVVIAYDLVDSQEDSVYDVSVKFKYTSGEIVFPKNPHGDVKSVSVGKNKTVVWDVLRDGQSLKGKVCAIVEITNTSHRKKYEPEMVTVQGDTFSMGSLTGEINERPIHKVSVSSFRIAKYKVTQAQWREVMGSNPSYHKNCDNCPVESVSWNEIQTFIEKLNLMTSKKYRLPTEAEWEFAAHGGVRCNGSLCIGSKKLAEVAWSSENSNNETHPVGQKLPNELGLYDMIGNVWEWCSDWYDVNYYSISPEIDPKGPSTGVRRVMRGGSWITYPANCRISYRYYINPSDRNITLGFRLVVSL